MKSFYVGSRSRRSGMTPWLPLTLLLCASISPLLLLTACEDEPLRPDVGGALDSPTIENHPPDASNDSPSIMGNGEVEIAWRGGRSAAGDSTVVERYAFTEFDIRTAAGNRPSDGHFTYRVIEADSTLHREIAVEIDGVATEISSRRLWFLGTVVADTKGCHQGPDGGHDPGCSDEGHPDDGCAGHDGGCSSDHDTGDGGCTGDHDPSDDGGTGDPGQPGGDGASGGHGASGRSCRVGQRLVAKMHDGGTPGVDHDGITWRWYLAGDPSLPSLADLGSWPHLCRKEILGGNLNVFAPPSVRPSVQTPD